MKTPRHQQEIDDGLARLRQHTVVPPIDPEHEQALLAAFDAHWARPRSRSRRTARVWTAAAAAMTLTLGIGRIAVTQMPRPETPDDTADFAGFVPWPGASALPPLESGELRRIELPRAALSALGLSAPLSAAHVVVAEIVIGQDGLARAVRLVPQQ